MTNPESQQPSIYDRYNYLGYIGTTDIARLVISPDNERELLNARRLHRYRSREFSRFPTLADDNEWALDKTHQIFSTNIDAVTALANYIAQKHETPAVSRDDIRQVADTNLYRLETAIGDSRFWIARAGVSAKEALRYRPNYKMEDNTVTWWSSFPQVQMTGGLYTVLAKLHNTHSRLYGKQTNSPEREVTQAMFEEWFAYTTVANSIAPYVWSRKFECRTLSNYSVVDLLSRLNEQELPDEQVMSTFAHRPQKFLSEYEWLVRNKHRRVTERAVGASERRHTARAKEVLAVESYQKFAADRGYGTILTVEKIENVNDVLFAVCAQQAQDAKDSHGEAQCNVWDKTVNKDVAEALRPKRFHGRLSNIRMVRLPFDDQAMEEYFSTLQYPDDIDRDSATRIGIVADMYSTGRGKIGESFQDVIVFTENLADVSKRKVKLSVRGSVTGDKVMEYLLRESYGRATLELIRGMSNPLSGGLPSLGRKH